jgi:Tol biopolymer transport system component
VLEQQEQEVEDKRLDVHRPPAAGERARLAVDLAVGPTESHACHSSTAAGITLRSRSEITQRSRSASGYTVMIPSIRLDRRPGGDTVNGRRQSIRFAGRAAGLALVIGVALAAGMPAGAQTPGTDCGCTDIGQYVEPDSGVRPSVTAGGLSPSGRYRVDVTSIPGQTPATLNVVRVSDRAVILGNVSGLQWGFSPDDDRFLIWWFIGSAGNQQFEYQLYDLAAGASASRPIWSNGPAPWSSARTRFSEDGSVFLFAGTEASQGVLLALLEIASGSRYETSFFTSTAPGDVDDDDNPTVAGWGFGPDPTRFVHLYTTSTGTGTTAVTRVNVATDVAHEDTLTANSAAAVFSPCGDTIALIVKQQALSDLTDVTLYETQDPHAGQLGSQNLANSALEVHATASRHHVLQAGVENPLAPNGAGDACGNVPPVADFTPPEAPVVGMAAAFTDVSTDADGSVVDWQWELGDGTTSSARNPSHTYTEGGTYTVRLTVTDDEGASGVVERVVSVCGVLGALSGRVLYEQAQDLYVLNASDGSRVRLTNRANSFSAVRQGRFSPDATRIVYAEGGIFSAGIWVMDADGSHRRRLTDGSGSTGTFDFHNAPAWSPDGEWIAFVDSDVTRPDENGIWIMRKDGSARAKVASTAWGDFAPSFAPRIPPPSAVCPLAPDQRAPGCYTLLFGRPIPGSLSSQILQISGDGGALEVVAAGANYGLFRMSPGGDSLVFTRFLASLVGPLGGVHRIFTRELSSGIERQITKDGDDVFWAPVWSPDGRAIAYSFSVDGVPGTVTNLDVGVTEPTGCDARTLLPGADRHWADDWATGYAVQSLGSIAGSVRLDTSHHTSVAGAVVEMLGDVHATATTDAQGQFVFENVPIGADVEIRLVSAPGYAADPAQTIRLGDVVGHVIAVDLSASDAQAHVTGTVRDASFAPLAGVVLTATGPGGPIVAVTDSAGVYALTLQNFGDYVITPSREGYRFAPPSVSGRMSGTRSFYFTASLLPPAGLIAFVSSRSGDDDIWVADADGGDLRVLVQDTGSQRDPAWAPDGYRLAYASDEGSSGFELWVLDLTDALGPTSLGVFGREPAWSPDGSRIVFATGGGLRVLDLADSNVIPLSSDPSDASPTWRPDGASIVFERSALDGTSDLYEIGLAPGAAEVPSYAWAGDDLDPAFAAVGGGFAFATQYGSPESPLQILASWPAGSWPSAEGRNPSWSQDGNQLAFDAYGAVYRIDPRGLTRPSFATIASSGTDRDPSWQPRTRAACTNGTDDDGDGYVDLDDSGCASATDTSERTSAPGCDNGLDDDGDGYVDMQDPGCPVPVAPFEDPICDNGLDDDGDGAIDAADPLCQSYWPYWEAPPSCGLGGELVFVVAMLHRRARRVGVST